MMKRIAACLYVFIILSKIVVAQNLLSNSSFGQIAFNFDGNIKSKNYKFIADSFSYDKGIDGQSLLLNSEDNFEHLQLKGLILNGNTSFTTQFWVKTTSTNPTVLLSQKQFKNKGLFSQKNAGWALYTSGGTFAWSIGSGKRRLKYERENGQKMPLNDGQWHHLSMTYDKSINEVRLYLDGENKAVYNVDFDFDNTNPIVIGAQNDGFDYELDTLPDIVQGARDLQLMVNEFNKLDVENVNEGEFMSLIVDPEELYLRKLGLSEIETKRYHEKEHPELDSVVSLNKKLYTNPYTVHQNKELTKLKPVSKIYELKDGEVIINRFYAQKFTEEVHLNPSDFSIDNLQFYSKALNPKEISKEYEKYRQLTTPKLENKIDSLTIAVWNIWHGGKHFTIENNDWDSRQRIAEMIKENNADIILMQEIYSSGDYIAAELGYYFATTSDWDYCHQGSNISVMSRFPIKELYVPKDAEFMNVAVKIAISDSQEIYAMSNWYGMSSFAQVYDFHKDSFAASEEIPILFGGDFNAMPHTDGGDSPASIQMMEGGFQDAYRQLHPDTEVFPGYTHAWGGKIDQLYYKGTSLENTSTKVIQTWFGGSPLIIT